MYMYTYVYMSWGYLLMTKELRALYSAQLLGVLHRLYIRELRGM